MEIGKKKMDPAIMGDLKRHRLYTFHIKSLLRAVRNRYSHHVGNPDLQAIEGPVPEGLDSYYSELFPALLMHVYVVVCRTSRGEEAFKKYYTFYN